MNYIHIQENKASILKFDSEFFIFLVLTICLLCITIGIWLWFERRASRLARTEQVKAVFSQEKQRQDV